MSVSVGSAPLFQFSAANLTSIFANMHTPPAMQPPEYPPTSANLKNGRSGTGYIPLHPANGGGLDLDDKSIEDLKKWQKMKKNLEKLHIDSDNYVLKNCSEIKNGYRRRSNSWTWRVNGSKGEQVNVNENVSLSLPQWMLCTCTSQLLTCCCECWKYLTCMFFTVECQHCFHNQCTPFSGSYQCRKRHDPSSTLPITLDHEVVSNNIYTVNSLKVSLTNQ